MDCSTPGLPVFHYIPEFAQIHFHWNGDAIQQSHLLSPSSPSDFNLSQHQSLFQWVDSWRWPKYWSFSFSIIPSKEHPGLISFRMDWLDLLNWQISQMGLFLFFFFESQLLNIRQDTTVLFQPHRPPGSSTTESWQHLQKWDLPWLDILVTSLPWTKLQSQRESGNLCSILDLSQRLSYAL